MIGRYEDAVAAKHIFSPYIEKGNIKLRCSKSFGWTISIGYDTDLKISKSGMGEKLDDLKELVFMYYPEIHINNYKLPEAYISYYYKQFERLLTSK